MNKRKKLNKKLLKMQIIFIAMFIMLFNMFANYSYAYTVTHTQTKRAGISAFPESYQAKLRELEANHPNWTFTAYNTGMSWSEFMSGERSHMRNTVHYSVDSSWKDSCGGVASGYACASSNIIAYYADPRNFLTEDRNIPILRDVIQFISTY